MAETRPNQAYQRTLRKRPHKAVELHVELIRTRIAYSGSAFTELVVWRLPKSIEGSTHGFKYRLAYVVRGECVLRYDNEAGKGDHRQVDGKERTYAFTTPD